MALVNYREGEEEGLEVSPLGKANPNEEVPLQTASLILFFIIV